MSGILVPMGKKKDPKPETEKQALNPEQELFCRYYTQGDDTYCRPAFISLKITAITL